MKLSTRTLLWIFIPLTMLLASCATRPAPDISGRWKPVNHFAAAPQAIPLNQTYMFYPAPMDGTLKNMLTRWARDSKLTLSYLHSSDFTLYSQVTDLRTPNLQDAIAQLNAAYAGEGVSISSDGRQLVVRQIAAAAAPAGDGASVP